MAKLDGGRVGGLLALSMLAGICFQQRAQADLPREVVIRWSGSCPRPFGLEAEVSQLLGGKRPQLPPTEVSARVERDGSAFELTLSIDSKEQRAEREMQLASCQEAQDAAVLLIATAIDPEAVMRAPPPPPPPPPPPVEVEPSPPVPAHRWSVLLGALFDLRSLPGAIVGPNVGALWQDERLRAWVNARYLGSRTAREDEPVEVAARVDLFAAALGGAYVWTLGPLLLGPAIELEAGALRAHDIRGPRVRGKDDAGPWGAASFGAQLAYRASARIGIELGLFAGVPLRRPELSVRDAGTFYTTDPVTMRLALAARVSLGSP